MNTFFVVLILVGFGAPWTWLLLRRSADATLEGVFDRICLGYASSFVLLFVSSQLRLWLFVPIWLLGVIACVVDAVRRRNQRRTPIALGIEGKILLGSAAFYLTLRCLPFLVRRMPLGWDAYFHMTISESIFARGRAVHDWMPYENIPLNYPIGSHLLLALTQWLTGVRPHQFFELMVVLFTLLTGLQLFSLGTRATQDRAVGCFTALAYLYLGNYGSLHYAIWSGLPNLIGMYLFLGLLTYLRTEEASRIRGAIVFATFFLGGCFVHHHVMVTSGLCLGWTLLATYIGRERELAKRIFTGLVVSAVAGSPYFGMYVLRTAGLANTGIEAYMEDSADSLSIARDIGIGFTAAVAAGVYLYFKNGERVASVVTQPLIAMLLLYVLVEFCVRTISLTVFNHEISPFTPSRFITDAVTLLSVFAGILFRTMQGESSRNRLALTGMLIAGFFIFNRGTYRDTFNREVSRERRAAYEWLLENTPADAGILDHDLHATYFTRRISSSFPLPTSEFGAHAYNRFMLDDIASGREPPERAGRPVFALVEPGARAPAGKLRWEHPSGFRVIESYGPQIAAGP